MRKNVFILALSVPAVLLACSSADIEGDQMAGKPVTSNSEVQSSNSQCSDVKLESADPATLPKCACKAGGTARCVPKAKVPSVVSGQLDACDSGGVCVPDKLVKSGGGELKTCKSAFGEGRCMDMCVPEVGQNAALLNRGEGDVCDEGERCVPCLNPLKNNEPTGVCEIGKQQQCASTQPSGTSAQQQQLACPYNGPPIVDVKTFASCGDGLRCVPTTLVPAGSAGQLDKCTAAGGAAGLCAPEKSIAAGGNFVPKTCSSIAGAEGRCLNANLGAIKSQASMLTRDTCDANELCAPCFSPIDGKETGACRSASCDQPKEAAKSFPGCCLSQGAARAKCVPKTIIPKGQQGNLDNDDGTCTSGNLCVPNEMLQPNFKGPACTGSTFFTGNYSGVCLSDCLSFSFIESLGISRGSCQKGFKCAPCQNPLTGENTGAPGCPGT